MKETICGLSMTGFVSLLIAINHGRVEQYPGAAEIHKLI